MPMPDLMGIKPVSNTTDCNCTEARKHQRGPNNTDGGFRKFGTVSFMNASRVSGFIDYLESGLIMGTRCKKCSKDFFPPRADCCQCMSSVMEWFRVKGSGRLQSFSTLYFAPAGFAQDIPYTVAVLDYGEYKIFGRIDPSIPECDLSIGMEMRTISHRLPNGNLSYVFKKS
jgi:hypothetical protein